MARGSRGGFKFDEFDAEDGSKLPIKLDRENGEFSIVVAEGEDPIKGTDLEDVKRRTKAWLAENRALVWKPMIAIEFEESRGWSRGHGISLEYHRAFVSTDAKGRTIVSTFDEISTDKDDRKDELQGKPGRRDSDWRYRPDENRVVLEYTPERWSALRLITRAIESIDEKLRLFLSKETADATLATIVSTGVANLLGGPAAKKPGVKR